MVDKKQDLSLVGYTLGIISIVLAFVSPLGGLIFGIIGFVQSKKLKTPLSKKARKLNTIGIILSIIILISSIIVLIFAKDIPFSL